MYVTCLLLTGDYSAVRLGVDGARAVEARQRSGQFLHPLPDCARRFVRRLSIGSLFPSVVHGGRR